jgi:hypothetical protein
MIPLTNFQIQYSSNYSSDHVYSIIESGTIKKLCEKKAFVQIYFIFNRGESIFKYNQTWYLK